MLKKLFALAISISLLSPTLSYAQQSVTTIGPWQSTNPFVDSNHKSHPLPSFAVGNRYYVHTVTNDGSGDRIVYMAQQQNDGSLGPWQVASSDHGGGPAGYTAVALQTTAFHFRNGHIAQYVINPSNGVISEIKLLENQTANNAFGGNKYVWDTAVYVPYIHAYQYIYHLGGFNFTGYSYNVNFMYRAGLSFPQTDARFYKFPNISVPTNNPNKAAFYKESVSSDRGYIYMGVRESTQLYRTFVKEDIATVPSAWIDTGNLPSGNGNNLGDMFVINNSLFVIHGSKVFKATINPNDGSLSAWDDSPPDLPEEQIDLSWDPTNTEGASFGIIGNYVYVTGPKKVYYAQITSNQQPTNTPIPTPTNTPPQNTATPTTTTTPTKPGDANGDNLVNLLDFEILRQEFNKIGKNLRADFNKDEKVNLLDFEILRFNFNK